MPISSIIPVRHARKSLPNGFLARALYLVLLFVFLGALARVDSRAQAPLTNFFQFSSTNYSVLENGNFILIDVNRTGDISVSSTVDFSTTDGTAKAGSDYFGQRGTLLFDPFVQVQQIFVQVFDNSLKDGNRTFNVLLSNPQGGTMGSPTNAVVTIIDDESAVLTNLAGFVQFSSGLHSITSEEWMTDTTRWDDVPQGAQLTIVRLGGSKGKILVDYATSDITAVDKRDYIGTTNTVSMDDFQMATNIVIAIPAVANPVTFSTNGLTIQQLFPPAGAFRVRLFNVRAAPEEDPTFITPQLGNVTNCTVNIIDNSSGFNFNRLHYTVKETRGHAFAGDTNKSGFVRIPVRRSYPINQAVHVHYIVNPRRLLPDFTGDHEGNLFPLEAGSDYAAPFADYDPPGPNSPPWLATLAVFTGPPPITDAILSWGMNVGGTQDILIPIVNDSDVEFNEDMEIILFKHDGEMDGFLGSANTCTLTILFDDEPAGAVDRTYNPDFDNLTSPPINSQPGANGPVQAMAVQPDGKLVIGGDFSAVNTTPRNGIARFFANGQLDTTFNPGSATDNSYVSAIGLQPDGKIVIGGGFNSINGTFRKSIARLNTNGVLDTTFSPGLGANGPIRALSVLADGKILIGGEFTTYDGTNQNYIARLNPDGKLDATFKPVQGPNGPINCFAINSSSIELDRSSTGGPDEDPFPIDTGGTSGSININANFIAPGTLHIYYEGNLIYDSGLTSGLQSTTLSYGPGSSTFLQIIMNEGSITAGSQWYYSITIFPTADSRPIVGGNFTSYDGVGRNYYARLNLDGTLDTSFNPGSGADDVVYSVAKLGNKVVVGGAFTTIDLRPRHGIARVNEDGSLDTEFFPGSGANNAVYSVLIQPDGKPLLGGIFTSINSTRRIGLARLNADGTVDTSFMDTAYNQFAGLINPLSTENILSEENFVRALGQYRLTNITFFTNSIVTNSITNFTTVTNISLQDQVFIGGKFKRVGGGFRRDDVRQRSNVARIIGGATPGPGNISFATPKYTIDKDGGQLFVTLVRTNGSLGPLSATFSTAGGIPGPGVAIPGADYANTTATPLWGPTWDADRKVSDALMGPNYLSFTTNRSRTDFTIQYPFPSRPTPRYGNPSSDDVFVPVFDNSLVTGDRVTDFVLSNPDGTRLTLGGEPIPLGAALGRAQAQLTIVDNNFNYGTLGLSATNYQVNENDKTVTVTVTRLGGSTGPITVDYATVDGTALSRSDFLPVKGTLSFSSGQTTNSFTVPIVDDTIAELDETFTVVLSNPTGFPAKVPPASRLDTNRTVSTVTIIDNDFAPGRLSFVVPQFTVNENDGAATVQVKRTGGNLGDVVVQYSTVDGSAKAGQDYGPVSGVLHWVDGDTSIKSFTVPVFENHVVASDKSFTVQLTSPVVQGNLNTNALGNVPTATVKIINDNAYGSFAFSQQTFNADENGGYAIITVLRQGGIAGTVSVDFAATNLDAVAGVNFVATNGTLTFGPGETSKSFRVTLIDNNTVNGDKQVALTLSKAVQGSIIAPGTAVLTIIDDELSHTPAGTLDSTFSADGTDGLVYMTALQADGKILVGGDFQTLDGVPRSRIGRLNTDGSLDTTFNSVPGPDNSVRSILVTAEGRILVGGLFNNFNGVVRNYLTRLNIDGAIDPTFNPGAGPDNPVYAMALQADGKAVIVGNFSAYNGVARNHIARVNTNGVVDANFNVGSGSDLAIFSVALQPDGKILIGGDFTHVNGVAANHLARLNANGSVDTNFNATIGPDRSIRAIAVQSDGNILIGGLFGSVNGTNRNAIARLRPNGSLDTTFNPGTGADGPVNAIAIQIDGKIVLGGDFTFYNGVTRNRFTRINADGSIDPTINVGTGANSTVTSIALQTDRRMVVVGGFTQFNDQPRHHIARIFGGSIAGSGTVEFAAPFYTVNASGTNAIITVRRGNGTTGTVTVNYFTTPGTAQPGTNFVSTSGTLVFPEGETFQTFKVPVISTTNITADTSLSITLTNVTGGAFLGPQPTTTLTIVNENSAIGFSAPAYDITENFATGSASITVTRTGSTAYPATVDFLTQDGTATAPGKYLPVQTTVTFAPGETSHTFSIPIINNNTVDGNQTVNLILTNLTGRAVVLGLAHSVLTIFDDDVAPGNLGFASATGLYTVVEGQGPGVVTVKRVGGSTGIVSVDYATKNGTATAGVDYVNTSGILSFADGETVKSFTIPILDNVSAPLNETVIITLSNPRGGAQIFGPATATLTIINVSAGGVDESFNPGTGANGTVRAVALDPINGQILIGGDFTSYNGVSRAEVARLNLDGSLDTSFNPGKGPNNYVSSINIQNDGKIIVTGLFNTFDDIIRNRVARLNPDGSLDPNFNLPLGLNAEVTSAAIQPDGKILIGGNFDLASAAGRAHIARINPSGSLDTSFDPGTGASDNVRAIALQPDGRIVIGGIFTSINGIPRSGIARLNANGTVDTSFTPGTGINGSVNAIVVQSDGKIVIAGDFAAFNGVAKSRVARLNADGTLDTTFDVGTGPNLPVYAMAAQPGGKIFIAGDFSQVNQALRGRVARLNLNGSLDGTFDPGIGADNTILDLAVQVDGKVVVVGKFSNFAGESRNGVARLIGDKILQPSNLRISNVQRTSTGQVKIQFTTDVGRSYVVEESSDLVTWTQVQTMAGTGGTVEFTETPPIRSAQRFYRVRRVGP